MSMRARRRTAINRGIYRAHWRFDAVLMRTLKARSGQIASNIMANNALLSRLMQSSRPAGIERDLSACFGENYGKSSMRCCALCLCDVPRESYNDHMRSHGYEILEIR